MFTSPANHGCTSIKQSYSHARRYKLYGWVGVHIDLMHGPAQNDALKLRGPQGELTMGAMKPYGNIQVLK